MLNYKNPKTAYYCICGWTYSSKHNLDRIEKHNKTCPYHSDYGVVPAFDPDDTSDSEAYRKEFIGYKQRLKNKITKNRMIQKFLQILCVP